MVSTQRGLLRLHIEAVWGVQLPPIAQNTVELLREGIQPSWKLYTAEMAGEQVAIWRPDVPATEREKLLVRASEALTLPPTGHVSPANRSRGSPSPSGIPNHECCGCSKSGAPSYP